MQTARQIDIDREAHVHRQAGSQTGQTGQRDKYRQAGTRTHAGRQASRQVCMMHACMQACMQAGREAGRQAGRLIDSMSVRQAAVGEGGLRSIVG